MFKFLKNKQNIQFIVTVAIVVGSITYSVYLISESEQIEEQIEELEIQLTELNEDKNRVQQLIGDMKERQSTLVGSLREFNELLENRLETDKELFIQLEQRIAAWQDVLKNADLSSTELTIVQAEIADVMQLLKRINEIEMVDLTESISEQSNSIETD